MVPEVRQFFSSPNDAKLKEKGYMTLVTLITLFDILGGKYFITRHSFYIECQMHLILPSFETCITSFFIVPISIISCFILSIFKSSSNLFK